MILLVGGVNPYSRVLAEFRADFRVPFTHQRRRSLKKDFQTISLFFRSLRSAADDNLKKRKAAEKQQNLELERKNGCENYPFDSFNACLYSFVIRSSRSRTKSGGQDSDSNRKRQIGIFYTLEDEACQDSSTQQGPNRTDCVRDRFVCV